MSFTVVHPDRLHATPNYSHGVAAAGRFLFISGQVALDGDGQLVGKGDIDAQADQVMRNLGTVLQEAGCGFEHVVRFGVLITERAHIPAWRTARSRYVQPPYPASTLMICGLVHEDWLIEVEATAVVPGA